MLSRVGGVNLYQSAVVTQFTISCMYCWAIEVGDQWRHNDVIVKKVITIDQNSRSQTAMESVRLVFQIVDRIRRQSSWASCEIC